LLCSRPPAPVEVYNDVHGDLVNLFKCLQSWELFEELAGRLDATLYARSEYLRAVDVLADPGAPNIDRPWAFFVATNMSTNASRPAPGRWSWSTESTGWAAKSASRWHGRLGNPWAWHDRLRHVQIEQRDAIDAKGQLSLHGAALGVGATTRDVGAKRVQ
jgi:DNA adenine methylase